MNKDIVTPKGIGIISIFPIVMFIFDPYAITNGGLAICDVLIFLMAFYLFATYGIAMYKPLYTLICIDVVLTLISFLFTYSTNTNFNLSFKIAIVFTLYLFVYSGIWTQILQYKDDFYKAVEIIGLICAVFALMQFAFASAGVDFYGGKLPFPMAKNSSFGGIFDANTGDLRVHSFFEEPSYLAFFEIPITIHLLQKKKYIKSIICGAACILSGSMIGILGLAISLITMLIFDSDVKISTKIRFIVLLVVLIVAVIILYNVNDSIKNLINYYMRRLNTIDNSKQREDSSYSQRISGYMDLFNNYNNFNKFFGMGFNQYSLYFGLDIDYSNDIVSNLLNFGYAGITALAFALISIAKRITGHGKVFFVIFCLLLAVDHSWFGAMFFYILTWVVVKSNAKQTNMFLKARV